MKKTKTKRLKLTPNKDRAIKILDAIYNNDGYCPCVITKTEDTICPCKNMMDNNECHCGLYE